MRVSTGITLEDSSKLLGRSEVDNRARFLTLTGTIIAQFALGSVYTWSLFNAGLAAKLGVSVSQAAFSFGILGLALALAASVSGKLQERFGVTNVTIGTGVLMAAGLLLTAHASHLWMLYLSAGIMLGAADGIGYMMTLTNCVRWFPDHKGLISALAIGAYGLGSLGFKYINLALLQNVGLGDAFMYWSILAAIIVIAGGLMMADARKQTKTSKLHPTADFSLGEAMRRPQFWMLALIFIINSMSGLYVIGVAKDIGLQFAHLSFAVAANAVAVIAVANLTGRLVLGVLADKMRCIRVVSLALIINLVGFITLMYAGQSMAGFYFALGCVAFCFGGTITVYPSLVSNFFGLNNLTKNYGAIYLGFGGGSLIGALIASVIGSYVGTFATIIGMLAFALVLTFVMRTPKPKEIAA